VLVLLILGLLFLLLGFILILGQRYLIEKTDGKRRIERIEIDNTNPIIKYRTLLGIFSTILGVLCIINYTIY